MTATGNLSVEAQTRYRYVAELLSRWAPAPCDLLELGSAPGDQVADLAQRGYRASSLDIGVASDSWGDGNEGRMLTLFADAWVTHTDWNLEDYPYPVADASCDVVLMTEAYEHLRDFPAKSLVEVHRIFGRVASSSSRHPTAPT